MEKANVFHEREGETLIVWFTQPEDKCKYEVNNRVVMIKNQDEKIIGYKWVC